MILITGRPWLKGGSAVMAQTPIEHVKWQKIISADMSFCSQLSALQGLECKQRIFAGNCAPTWQLLPAVATVGPLTSLSNFWQGSESSRPVPKLPARYRQCDPQY